MAEPIKANNQFVNSDEHRIFFTSDTHFGHSKIIEYTNRPFADADEMNEELIRRWNDAVRPQDTVFHLGDVAFGNIDVAKECLDRLNGRIILCIGNHDMHMLSDKRFTGRFESINWKMYVHIMDKTDGKTTAMYLNHEPLMCFGGAWRFGDRLVWNLFGHVHSGPNTKNGLDIDRLSQCMPSHYDVGVDNNDYTPVYLGDLKNIINTQVQSLNMHRG